MLLRLTMRLGYLRSRSTSKTLSSSNLWALRALVWCNCVCPHNAFLHLLCLDEWQPSRQGQGIACMHWPCLWTFAIAKIPNQSKSRRTQTLLCAWQAAYACQACLALLQVCLGCSNFLGMMTLSNYAICEALPECGYPHRTDPLMEEHIETSPWEV